MNASSTQVTCRFDSPLGSLTLREQDDRLTHVLFAPSAAQQALPGSRPMREPSTPLLRNATEQLQEYFAGSRLSFRLGLDPQGTPFRRRAWEALQRIPYGATWSYARQAQVLGAKRLARPVGQANANNPIAVIVPCHRVVGSSGRLTGYAAGMDRKRMLLQLEADTLERIHFAPLQREHFSLLQGWLNAPHANAAYGEGRRWTDRDVTDKYSPLVGECTPGVAAFVVQSRDQCIGYIQRYVLARHQPTATQEQLRRLYQHIDQATSVGLDLLIGEQAWVGKGFGSAILRQFLGRHVWPRWKTAVVDPDRSHAHAIRAYTKAGFSVFDPRGKNTTTLMIARP
ncbi:MAG: GNAT family N-acetyltransferase [Myxococcota bacterium]